MLKALYDYAHQHELVLPEGYVNKTIKAYIVLTTDGRFVGVDMGGKAPVACPDIGSMANSRDKCNPLAEKRSIVASNESGEKIQFFRQMLKEGARYEPMLGLCTQALENEDVLSQICTELDRQKVKSSDRISFCVGEKRILDSKLIREWWDEFRKSFSKTNTAANQICLITGEYISPIATVPPINGLAHVGGHQRGDALICFDKTAFCSYGLKQAANASVSEKAMGAVKAALDHLLQSAPVLAGMKFVHWYDCPMQDEEDVLLNLFKDEWDGKEDDEESRESQTDAYVEEEKARRVVLSPIYGMRSPSLTSVYHILLLTGVNGRVMIRRYERGSYEELQRRLNAWFEDISLCSSNGGGVAKTHKLFTMLIRLLKKQKLDTNIPERMGKELAGVTPAILIAILTGGVLPDSVAVRALSFIRSQMLEASDQKWRPPDTIACQWLKAWLCRREKQSGEVVTMAYYNSKHPSKAYHCGRMVAVYTWIQKLAMPQVNTGITERYYASASQVPALVLGTLSRMSTYHLTKIEKPSYKTYLEGILRDVACALGDEIPQVLTPEEQAYFALGYYQQWAMMQAQKKKTSDENSNTTDDDETKEMEE